MYAQNIKKMRQLQAITRLLKDYQMIIEVKDVLKIRFQNFNVKISLQVLACPCT